MKKFLTLVMLVLLLGSFGVACSDDDDTGSANTLAAFAGKSWTLTQTSDSGSEIKTYTFQTNLTFTLQTTRVREARLVNTTEYSYETGTWSVENGNLVTIATQSGSSSISVSDAISQSSVIETPDRNKNEFVGTILSGTKLSLSSFTGGNTSDLTGTWGSLTAAEYKKYRMKDGVWTVAQENYTKVTLTTAATNYRMIKKRWYNEDTGSWLSAVEYQNENERTWQTTAYTNDYPITSWEILADNKLKAVIGGMMVKTNEYIISGSRMGFDPYSLSVPQ